MEDYSAKTWNIGQAILKIRNFYGLSRKDFGDRLGVSPAYISALEKNSKKKPSLTLIKLLCHEFSINQSWLETGTENPFQDSNENVKFEAIDGRKDNDRNKTTVGLIAVATVLGTFSPLAALGLALGVGADKIIERMLIAYDAKNITELAQRHFKIDRSYISHWIKKNNVPIKYLQKAAKDNHLEIDYFLADESTRNLGRKICTEFAQEVIIEDRKKHIDLKTLESRLDKFLNSTKLI